MKQPVTINDHAHFRRSLADVGKLVSDDDLDDIDAELDLANPVLDRIPQRASKRQAKGVLSILDQLDREGRRR
jgi:hypothetical protein